MGKDCFYKEKKYDVSAHTSERSEVCKKLDFMDEATLNVLAYGLMSFCVLNVLEKIFAFNVCVYHLMLNVLYFHSSLASMWNIN